MLQSFNNLSLLPEGGKNGSPNAQYGVLYNSTQEEFVTFNLKCLSEGSEGSEDSLPGGDILDKVHDWKEFAMQKSCIVTNIESEGSGILNDIKYTKEGDSDQNESRLGFHLDGSLSVDQLFIGKDEDYDDKVTGSLYFKNEHFDIPNKYIGSCLANEKTEGRSDVGGFGIEKFIHESDSYDELFSLGQKIEDEPLDKRGNGPLTLISDRGQLRVRLHSVGGGVKIDSWDKYINAEEEMQKWDWSIFDENNDYNLKDRDSNNYISSFEWYEDILNQGSSQNDCGSDAFQKHEREMHDANKAERQDCFDEAWERWYNPYINPNYIFDPDNEDELITPIGNFKTLQDGKDEVFSRIFLDGKDCELTFLCDGVTEIPEFQKIPDGSAGRDDGFEIFNDCVLMHCKGEFLGLVGAKRPSKICGCGDRNSSDYEPCKFELLLNKIVDPSNYI